MRPVAVALVWAGIMNIAYREGPYTPWRWARPCNAYGRWLVVHDPGNDAAQPGQILQYLRTNPKHDSYGEFVWLEGDTMKVVKLCPDWQYTGHAGVATRIPGTTIRNTAVNWWTYSTSICTYGKRLPAAALEAFAQHLAIRVGELGLPDAGVILAHREISTVPGRRSDPRGIDMNELRAEVAKHLR